MKLKLVRRRLNESDLGVNGITDPNALKKLVDVRTKMSNLEQQRNNIQKQINDLKRDELNVITAATTNQSKAEKQLLDNKLKEPVVKNDMNVNQNGNVTTSPYESVSYIPTSLADIKLNEDEIADDVKFTSQVDPQQQDVTAPSDTQNAECIYVKFKNDLDQIVKGKVYRTENNGEWRTEILVGSCESFEDLAFDKNLKRFGILDKLSNFFDDVEEISSGDQDDMLSDSILPVRTGDIFEYLFSGDNINDI